MAARGAEGGGLRPKTRPAWNHRIHVMRTIGADACRCGEPIAFSVQYTRYTGRVSGNKATTTRYVCRFHGEAFAQRYGLALPGPEGAAP